MFNVPTFSITNLNKKLLLGQFWVEELAPPVSGVI